MQNKIQLTLELPEVNQILAALGKLPYENVYVLIETIKGQAHQQIEEQSNQNGLSKDQNETKENTR